MSPARSGIFVGAYAASPTLKEWNSDLEEEYLLGIEQVDGVRGLELPWIGSLHRHDEAWLLRSLAERFDLIVTDIPWAVGQVASTPEYGLASRNQDGRRAALEDVARLRDDVHRLNAAAGRQRVVAVELHSAPRADLGAGHALAESLREIQEWDWAGAQLVIEHCDALVEGNVPEKGFLSLDDELDAIRDTTVGVSINWGRSAIELRDAQKVAEQIATARASGRLRGLILSGAAQEPGAFGPAWRDSHLPFDVSPGFPWGDSNSLLTIERAREALEAAGKIDWLGFKFGWMREDSSVADRVEMIKAATRILRGL